jgi:hypothetical protein
MSDDKLTLLLEYVRAGGRVCPNPQEWQAMWEMLPDKQRVGSGWNPPLPLILAAWAEPAIFKILRLEEHIRYAAEHQVIDQIDAYLRSPKPHQWHILR